MPLDSHSGINVSKSRMFCAPRYNTGVTLCSVATVVTALIGDGFVLPVANQLSGSVTQKSLSMCAMIANLSVNITSPSVVNSRPVVFRCWIISWFGVALGDKGVSGVLSKFMSAKTGISGNESSNDMSKSVGNGKSSVVSGCSVTGTGGVTGSESVASDAGLTGVFGIYAVYNPAFLIARVKCGRISSGTSDGICGVTAVMVAGASVVVSEVSFLLGPIVIFGSGIFINGFLLRIIRVVLAI